MPTKLLLLLLFATVSYTKAQNQDNIYMKLIGVWEIEKVSVETGPKASAVEKKDLKKFQAAIIQTNESLHNRTLIMRVEFDLNGIYQFNIIKDRQTNYAEKGNFYVEGNILRCGNDQGSECSFDQHVITRAENQSITMKVPKKNAGPNTFDVFVFKKG